MNYTAKVIICVLGLNYIFVFYLLFKCEESRIIKNTTECKKLGMVYVYDRCVKEGKE